MYKKNYKGEDFIETNSRLIKKLNGYSNELKRKLTSKGEFNFVTEILKKKHRKDKVKGIYAFAQVRNKKLYIKYIGISKNIYNRFYYHTAYYSPSASSWINLMLKKKYPKHKELKENKNMLNKAIDKIRKKEIHPCRFVVLEIQDNMILHIAEVFCVNKLHSLYNSFETH